MPLAMCNAFWRHSRRSNRDQFFGRPVPVSFREIRPAGDQRLRCRLAGTSPSLPLTVNLDLVLYAYRVVARETPDSSWPNRPLQHNPIVGFRAAAQGPAFVS